MDAKGNEFTDKQLLKLVNANAEKPSHDLVQGLVAALTRHRGTADQSDDITILTLARKA
jgi:serine phosphatase RsbU (regulator of sigma subunit)